MGIYTVEVEATSNNRTDFATGAVSIANLRGDDLANALMKAETKAKRRATLSICGLGWMDETELETVPNAVKVTVDDTGNIGTLPPLAKPEPVKRDNGTVLAELGVEPEPVKANEKEKPWNNDFVTLEIAQTAVDSKGKFYFDMTTPELAEHMNNLLKTKVDQTDAEKETRNQHRQIVQAILNYRNSK
jgi:hypothetical protein